MSFGPAPYKMAQVREESRRAASKSKSPCSGDVPNELVSIGQAPGVKVPSVFDDAVQTVNTLEEKLKVNVNAALTKAEAIQKSVQGAISEATGEIGAAIDGAVRSAFSSVEGLFGGTKSKDCVALGIPDTKTLDANAFGGGLGEAPSIPSVSQMEDEEQAQIAEQLEAGVQPTLPELGGSLPKPPTTGVAKPLPTGVETAVLEPQKFVVPAPPEIFDGGGF